MLSCGFEQASPVEARAVVDKLGGWEFLCDETFCKVKQKLANKIASILLADENFYSPLFFVPSFCRSSSPAIEGSEYPHTSMPFSLAKSLTNCRDSISAY